MTRDGQKDWYVVYCYTHYQDGHDEHCVMKPSLDEAIAYINKRESGTPSPLHDPTDYKVFKLGREVLLKSVVKKTEQPAPPPKEQNVYSVRAGNKSE